MNVNEELKSTVNEKIRVVSEFLLHAPPGEFDEVFNDVRMLVNNDSLLKEGCARVCAQYSKDQFVPVKLAGTTTKTLITPFNELPDGRFRDPKSSKTFRYDHLRKEAVDIEVEVITNPLVERWRNALQEEADKYTNRHYKKRGTATVFNQGHVFTLCIESHQFQPRNFWNGRWRSQWVLPVGDGKSGMQELKGSIKVHVHYYEDGNIQLVSTKDITSKVVVSGDCQQTAKDIFEVILDEESTYQDAMQKDYQQMSATTFKALRRQLPVTSAKFDWSNTHTYRIGKDLKPQS